MFIGNFCARNANARILTQSEIEDEKKRIAEVRAKKKADKAAGAAAVSKLNEQNVDNDESRRASQVSDDSTSRKASLESVAR
jgi:phage-related minor tail protein